MILLPLFYTDFDLLLLLLQDLNLDIRIGFTTSSTVKQTCIPRSLVYPKVSFHYSTTKATNEMPQQNCLNACRTTLHPPYGAIEQTC